MPTFDVAVIGAGMAGVAAALAAQMRGARTCLVRGAPGATALASGAWRGPLRPEIRTALAQAGFALEKAEYPLLHERGRTLTCDFAARSHLLASAHADAVVCGIHGYPQFHAPTLARVWSPNVPMRTTTVRLSATPSAGWTTISLAAAIEQNVQAFAQTLPQGETLLLPPLLGVEQHEMVRAQLQAAGFRVAEVLAAVPSIPGWRLLHALERTLAAHGITVFSGRARLSRAQDRMVVAVRTPTEEISAGAFVLATGKFTSGGIAADAELRENVLALPVWLEHLGDVFTAADALSLTDPVRTESQALLHAGVHTDQQQRPVDRSGAVVYGNVFAAATVRAGWAAAVAGLGHCAEDGWTAGVSASA